MSIETFWNGQRSLVVALAYPWQGTTTSTLLRRFRLTILRDGYALQVPLLVERTRNSPVMRDAHSLPLLLVA